MHKSATKCNKTLGKWCKNKNGASKIMDTFETYHKPWVIHLRETCCCSTNLCTWRPNIVYKNRRVRRHQCAVATREKTTFLCPRAYALFTLHTLLNAVICYSQLNTQEVLGWFPASGLLVIDAVGWRSMYLVVMLRVNLIVILSTYARYLYSINFPTIICLPSICYLSYGETPLVNCGPRSNFLYIAITCLLYSHYLLYSHTTTVFHSIRSFLCLQQTGEIDNLIVSWEQSSWLCCVQVSCCRWRSK
jgi:hypothetical protein